MPKVICRFEDLYFEYSTVVDRPVSKAMKIADFKMYYEHVHGKPAAFDDARFSRVEAKGTSSLLDANLEEVIAHNRYGDNGNTLSVLKFIEKLRGETSLYL